MTPTRRLYCVLWP